MINKIIIKLSMEPSGKIVNESIKLLRNSIQPALGETERNFSSQLVVQRLHTKTANIKKNRQKTGELSKRDFSNNLKRLLREKKNSNSADLFKDFDTHNKQNKSEKSNSQVNNEAYPTEDCLLSQIHNQINVKFELAMNDCFVDSFHNSPELYEDYVLNNLKVIKIMQYFFNQFTYDSVFLQKQSSIFLNLKIDYLANYLLIDLDETLIHSEVYKEENRESYDRVIEIKYNGERPMEKLGIYLRPFAFEFVEFLAQHFKLIIFTAAELKYSQSILEAVGLISFFEAILDREYTIEVKGFFIKDLALFNREDSKLNCLLIDNSIFSFAATLSQGILVSSFYSSKEDTELEELKNYFEVSIIPQIQSMIAVNCEYYMYQELMQRVEFDDCLN